MKEETCARSGEGSPLRMTAGEHQDSRLVDQTVMGYRLKCNVGPENPPKTDPYDRCPVIKNPVQVQSPKKHLSLAAE